jgi:hypothetical protein
MTRLDLLQVRAIVTDAEVLGRLQPAAVAAYLQRTGWFRAHERASGAIWTRWLDDRAVKVFLPTDQTAADFAPRMGVLLGALAVAEDRSQLAVLADLCGVANPPSGAERIAAERRRQIEEEGWTPEHDDAYGGSELIEAARCYAYAALVAERHDLAEWFGLDGTGRIKVPDAIHARWPWLPRDWKPTNDPIRNLVKAVSLIAAEIDRLVRRAVAAEVQR